MSSKQKTVKASFSFEGRGLHTGQDVKINVLPAEADSGIIFKRIDLEGEPEVPALSEFVVDTSRGTTIEREEARVSTIEHLMAALWGMGVDNAMIEISGGEVPIMDGSSRAFAEAIKKVGLEELDAQVVYHEIGEKVTHTLEDSNVTIEIYPDDKFSASVHIDYNSKVLGNQYATFEEGDDFAEEIAPCRTFVFLHELEPLLNNNLIKGGDLDNAIVVVENPISDGEFERLAKLFDKKDIEITGGYLNNLELRFINEPARHKLLDVIGDLALIGTRIKGRVVATRPGHKANTEFAQKIRREMRRGTRPRFNYDPSQEPYADINHIMDVIPHRPPFLLVDKIIHIDSENVVGIKNVTMNEPFFVGHFPEEPVMPGVLIVEAMAQCGGILALNDVDEPEKYSTYFLKIDDVRFKQKVVPGDTLQFELRLAQPIRRGIVVMEAKAFVGGVIATEAMLMAQVVKNK